MDNYNPHYDDRYFSREGGLEESEWVFLRGNELEKRTSSDTGLTIGETGFGTGLNLLAAARYLSREAGDFDGPLHYHSLEKYPLKPPSVAELLQPFAGELGDGLAAYLRQYENLHRTVERGWNSRTFNLFGISVELSLYIGDVLEALSSLEGVVDAWFLDGHDPEKNRDMWCPEVFRLLADNSRPGTGLATYTARGFVKQGLREAGFTIRRQKGFGRKRHMISGIFQG